MVTMTVRKRYPTLAQLFHRLDLEANIHRMTLHSCHMSTVPQHMSMRLCCLVLGLPTFKAAP
jgi:hypothetical protein